ncbi:hypothetical protein JVT61DRAFT_3317 [Boletus reticuloceps]|uniref:Uncharacterized protein n=1 Tax=Boletus reticuloceps TaxID=495285 RepID=A0A8I2YNJ7_9AGAM|nr:hypothetical protein JVT61DRAFT_3317 [Boletus reticuloceps]
MIGVSMETAEFIFKQAELSVGNIDDLCDLWGRSLEDGSMGKHPPYVNHKELYATIDATPQGDIPWSSFKL